MNMFNRTYEQFEEESLKKQKLKDQQKPNKVK